MAITAAGKMPATILENGRAGDWSAVSHAGHAVTIRAADELGSIHLAPDGLILRWRNGEALRLDSVEDLTAADGRLELDGASQSAVLARIYEATTGFSISGWDSATFGTLLNGGITLQALAGMFLSTPDAQGRLAGLDQTGQITLIYTSLFGFAPELDALDYLTWALGQGVPLADLTVWLASLPEAAQAFEASHPTGLWIPDLAGAAVIRAYDAMLNMTPDPASLTIWQSAIASDPSALHILYATLMETEMHIALYDGLSDEAWVAGHYRAALERDATPAELAHSTGLVASGAVSYLDMAVAIGELQPLPEVPRFSVPGLDLF
ncbi:hypothetical protein [Roseomonas xinghualingensis]|uniref:hypothetical protein n=1 Tax=Roseomonas xinghualingensis TaxID=2986475 RepID=UPI0021F0F107|nr:hypothetical protein [Roseomonas sp. SXEYE001]MCV4207393.1 hypothetical protein [Roseomonas sp. SXEYE001]